MKVKAGLLLDLVLIYRKEITVSQKFRLVLTDLKETQNM